MIGRLLVGGLLDRLCGPCSRPRRLAPPCAGRRDQSKLLDLGVLRRTHQLTDGLLVDTEPLRNRSVAQPMALECLNAAQPLSRDNPSATRPARVFSPTAHTLPAPPSLPARSAPGAGAPCAQIFRTRAQPPSAGQNQNRPTTPSHRPLPRHHRSRSDAPAVPLQRSPADAPPPATYSAH